MSDVFPDANAFFTRSVERAFNAYPSSSFTRKKRTDEVARREKESPPHRLDEEKAKLLESLFQRRERECKRTHHREDDEHPGNRRRGAGTVRARNLDERRFSPLLQTASRFRRATHDARVREKTRVVDDAKSAREGETLGQEQKRRKGVDIVLGRDTDRGEG